MSSRCLPHPPSSGGGSNYIFIVEMAGLRIAHFGGIGQDALTPEQLKILGQVDFAITQLSNMCSGMSAGNKKVLNLINQSSLDGQNSSSQDMNGRYM